MTHGWMPTAGGQADCESDAHTIRMLRRQVARLQRQLAQSRSEPERESVETELCWTEYALECLAQDARAERGEQECL